jgi:hypothetical protein
LFRAGFFIFTWLHCYIVSWLHGILHCFKVSWLYRLLVL